MSLAKKSDLFEAVEDHARSIAADLLSEWLPDGVQKGREWIATNPVRTDRHRGSFKVNTTTYKWRDWADDESAKGGGLVSLYAYLHLGGNSHDTRTKAMLELGKRFGLIDGDSGSAKVIPLHRQSAAPKPKGDDWQSMVPPPDNVGRPPIWGNPKVHEYRMPGVAFPVRYVARIEKPDGAKLFLPWTYGTDDGVTGWHQRHPKAPMCLYGLDRAAALPDAPLLIQEGEQKTDDVQGVLGDGWACVAWSGGANAVPKHDWTVAAGRNAYVCGDAVDGVAAMMEVAEIIHGKAASVWTVDTSGFPKGWDLGNAATGKMVKKSELVWEDPDGPWSRDKIEAFIQDRAKPFIPDTGDVDLKHPDEDDSEWKEDDDPTADRRRKPPLPLGVDHGVYYYLSPMTRQVHALTAGQHTAQHLCSLADHNGYWFQREDLKTDNKGRVNWTDAAAWLMSICSDLGIYNPDRMRGRGAYLEDDGRPVLHLGDRLLVNGESLPLMLSGSRYIYEAAQRLNYAEAEPLGPDEAAELLEICKLFSWEKPISATLIAGWLVVAPICGALFWRPSIWVTGGSGSGKSTLEKLVMKPALGGIGLFVKGGTTEAGIRQKLYRDARPLVFDEAEAESQKAKATLQGLLELNRQSSSEGGAEIIKGTQSQTGSKTYHVKSCFAFSSINPTLDHLADENRVTVLELKNPRAPKPEEFEAMVARITRTMTPEFCAGLIARSVALMPTILKNAEVFARAVTVHLGSSRVGDQIGTMMAGAYAAQESGEVSFETALERVKKQDWEDATSVDADPDERRMLNHLMQTRVTLDLGNRKEDLTLAELVQTAERGAPHDEDPKAASVMANNELKRHGLWFDAKESGVWVSNTHKALKKHLDGTPWSSKWERTLRRLPGTRARERSEAAIRFAGSRDRATFVPMGLIE